MLSALLVLLPLQDEAIPRLIDLLADESVDVRQDAAARLAAMGRAALPALRKAADSADAQRSGAARDLLALIAKRLRVEEYRPPCVRANLTFQDEPFEQALEKLSKTFGIDVPACDEAPRRKNVSIDLKNATLWESIDALCRAGEAEISGLIPGEGRVGFDNRLLMQERYKKPFPYRKHQNLEDVRLLLCSSALTRNDKGPWKVALTFVAVLPPKAWIENARFSDLKLTLNDRALEHSAPTREATCHRVRGLPTRVTVGRLLVPHDQVSKGRPFDVAGVLLLDVPEQLEDLRPLEDSRPQELKFPFGTLTGSWNKSSREYMVSTQGQSGNEALAIQVAVRGPQDEWLCDMAFRVRPQVSFQTHQSEVLTVAPARLEAWRVVRTATRSIPFRFTAVVAGDPE